MNCKAAIEFLAKSETEPIFEIILSNWPVLTEIVLVLQVVYDATMAIQDPCFTLSDFYCCWMRIQIRLQRINSNSEQLTDLCNLMLENLKNRKRALLNHPAMLCAVFLDPRIHRELELEGETDFKIAKLTLANLNERILILKNASATHSDADDSLERYYNESTQLGNFNEQHRRTQFMEELDHFHRSLQYMKLDKNQTIFDFWEEKKILFPALYEVACVVNAIPPSQATVERAFSILKFMFSELRTSIDQDKLENLLMIKLNADLANSINENDIREIKEKYSTQSVPTQ